MLLTSSEYTLVSEQQSVIHWLNVSERHHASQPVLPFELSFHDHKLEKKQLVELLRQ